RSSHPRGHPYGAADDTARVLHHLLHDHLRRRARAHGGAWESPELQVARDRRRRSRPGGARGPRAAARPWAGQPLRQNPSKKESRMIDLQKYRKAAYLKASDLTATRTKVRILSVGEEEIGTPAETKVVLHFTSDQVKPMVCNYTNLVTLVEAFGPDEQ